MSSISGSNPQSGHFVSRCRHFGLPAAAGFAALLAISAPALGATAVSLGTAQSFAVIGGQSVTNTGPTIVKGDLGIAPGNTVTGFPPGLVVAPATIHAADALAAQAQIDVTTAYNALTAQTCDFGPFGPTDLAGQTLIPGVYCYSSSVQNSGTVTLSGTAADVWVFKIGSTLTTGPGSGVAFLGGAQTCNVFWQVGSSATLDTTTTWAGDILALTSITMNTHANLAGRVLARNGSVTLDSNTVDATACGAPTSAGVALFKQFVPATIDAGGLSALTITLNNTNSGIATLTADFTDNLPVGLTTVGLPATTCGVMSPTATATSVTLPVGATIPGGTPGTPGFCTVSVDVTSSTAGSFLDVLPADALQTNLGNSPGPGPAVLLVVVTRQAIPTLSEWALMLLAMLLAATGWLQYRRRR